MAVEKKGKTAVVTGSVSPDTAVAVDVYHELVQELEVTRDPERRREIERKLEKTMGH